MQTTLSAKIGVKMIYGQGALKLVAIQYFKLAHTD